MKVSFITTFFNEEGTIQQFLESLASQSVMPEEIILVDGGSLDMTMSRISNFQFPISNVKVKILTKKGNRSVGRNEAVRQATGDIIACSDVGCILDKDWLKNIIAPFDHNEADVVAGYYKARAKTVFQKCVVPYALVMPDKVDPKTFLPATRSIAFKKKVWEKIGGFDEKLSHNEDYEFAKRLKAKGMNIVFAKDAFVYWIPRKSVKEAYIMFWRFAYGDAEAKIWRPKVIFLFVRYMAALLLIFWVFITKSRLLFVICCLLFAAYIIWSILKNYRYVKNWRAAYYLPILQFTADFAVMSGSIQAIFKAA